MRRASKTEIWSCSEMTLSATISLANALMSPFFWSISTRNSRAGPTAFLAADSNASWTAADQDITVDAFFALPKFQNCQKICVHNLNTASPHPANKKVGR